MVALLVYGGAFIGLASLGEDYCTRDRSEMGPEEEIMYK